MFYFRLSSFMCHAQRDSGACGDFGGVLSASDYQDGIRTRDSADRVLQIRIASVLCVFSLSVEPSVFSRTHHAWLR